MTALQVLQVLSMQQSTTINVLDPRPQQASRARRGESAQTRSVFFCRYTTGKSTCNPDISSWDVSAALDMASMFEFATSLSDCNKALMHASFVAQTSAWKYSWGWLACPPPSPPASPPSASPSPPPPSALRGGPSTVYR